MKKQALALAVISAVSSQAGAFMLDTGEDWNIRWDNRLKGSIMARVEKQDRDVYAADFNPLAAQIADDSDLSVDRGSLVSTRVDILSELDVIWKDDYGFRISAAAWYDPMYDNSDNRKGDRTLQNGFSPANATWGSLSVDPNDYTNAAQKLHYAGGELLDAFAFMNIDLTDNIAANLRLGRHTLYWGQSLLGTGALHGVAGSMVAIDLAKAFGAPGSEAKDLFMPNSKVSTVAQLSDNLTFNAFYAFEHVVNRFPESGTYFNPAELLTDNAQLLVVAPGPMRAGYKVQNDKIKDSGEWGVNFQYYIERWNLETSFIYINATTRSVSGLYTSAGVSAEDQARANQKSSAFLLGYYGWVYKNEVDTYGFSLSKEVAGISMGMDLVYRKDMAINADLASSLFGRAGTNISDWSADGKYPGAVGDSLHLVINGLGLLNGDLGLWDGGSYIYEATFSMLTDFSENEIYANNRIHKNRVVSHIAVNFNPTWYQVFPGWDMTLPVSVSYTIDGEQAPISQGGNEEIGSGSLGVQFKINEVWDVSAKYNMFFGPAANGTAGLLKDRDNVSLTLKRTF